MSYEPRDSATSLLPSLFVSRLANLWRYIGDRARLLPEVRSDPIHTQTTGSLTLLIAMAAVSPASVHAQFSVSIPIFEIPTFGGAESNAMCISPSGLVAGTGQITGNLDRAFFFDGTFHNLGVLPGGFNRSVARGVNDSGQVVGYCSPGSEQPFLWERSTGQLLDIDPFNSGSSNAFAINASRVIGGAWFRAGQYSAATNAGIGAGTTTFLPWPRCAAVIGINDAGIAVGDSWSGVFCTSGSSEPFIWNGTTFTILPKLATGQTIPYDINNFGLIVGESPNASLQYQAVYWNMADPQVITQIGTLGGTETRARAVNDDGTIVGYGRNSLGQLRAFKYENGQMVNLNDLLPQGNGWTLNRANDINNDGVIVGQGINPSGQVRGFIFNGLEVVTIATDSTCEGGVAHLSVSAKGIRPFTFQWQRESIQALGTWISISDGSVPGIGDFSGAATPTLTVSNISPNAIGRYRCIVTNSCGSVTSKSAEIAAHSPVPLIELVPVLSGSDIGTVQALSGGGTYSFGRSGPPAAREAFCYVQGGTTFGLGDLPGGVFNSVAFACNRTGEIAFGGGNQSGLPDGEAFEWTQTGGLVGLGWAKPGDLYSVVRGCSADGSTAVGTSAPQSNPADFKTAFRWTAAGGMQNLGDLAGGFEKSDAYECSADGSVVVGSATDAIGRSAARWLQSGSWQSLGYLPAGTDSHAYGCSSDGNIIVGSCTVPGGLRGFVWTPAGGMLDIGDLNGGFNSSRLWRISPDGTVAVGYSNTANGDEAAVWDAANGLRRLADVIVARGGSIPSGWQLVEARAISSDKGSVGGFAVELSTGNLRGFIVRLGSLNLGIPIQPADTQSCPSGTASLSLSAVGDAPLSYQWQGEINQLPGNWVDISDGTIIGVGDFSGTSTPTMTISAATMNAAGNYRCIVTNSCGTITSHPALLTICPADFNCDGELNFFDYLDFVDAFSSNVPDADFNTDGGIDFFDYLDFVDAFSIGC